MKGDVPIDPESDPGGSREGIALDVVHEERKAGEFVCASEIRIGFVASSIESLQCLGEGMRVGQGCHSWLLSRLDRAVYQIARNAGPRIPLVSLGRDGATWKGFSGIRQEAKVKRE